MAGSNLPPPDAGRCVEGWQIDGPSRLGRNRPWIIVIRRPDGSDLYDQEYREFADRLGQKGVGGVTYDFVHSCLEFRTLPTDHELLLDRLCELIYEYINRQSAPVIPLNGRRRSGLR